MRTLVLPLSTDSDGVIIDGNGHEIADLWAIDKAGKMRVTEESEAAMRKRAAEIVLRCNLHDELVALVKDAAGGLTVGLREVTLARLAQIQSTLPEGR